jgi:hypothetical protein
MAEDCILEVLREHAVVAECPDSVEDSHDARDSQHDCRKDELAFTFVFHRSASPF